MKGKKSKASPTTPGKRVKVLSAEILKRRGENRGYLCVVVKNDWGMGGKEKLKMLPPQRSISRRRHSGRKKVELKYKKRSREQCTLVQ